MERETFFQIITVPMRTTIRAKTAPKPPNQLRRKAADTAPKRPPPARSAGGTNSSPGLVKITCHRLSNNSKTTAPMSQFRVKGRAFLFTMYCNPAATSIKATSIRPVPKAYAKISSNDRPILPVSIPAVPAATRAPITTRTSPHNSYFIHDMVPLFLRLVPVLDIVRLVLLLTVPFVLLPVVPVVLRLFRSANVLHLPLHTHISSKPFICLVSNPYRKPPS